VNWFENRLNAVKQQYHSLITGFRLSEALVGVYQLIWDDFCSWYLEWVKPEFVDGQAQGMDAATIEATKRFFEELMHLLHPFMPFISEELYHLVNEQSDDLAVKQFAPGNPASDKILAEAKLAQDLISAIRDVRNKQQIKPKDKLALDILSTDKDLLLRIQEPLMKAANLSAMNLVDAPVEGGVAFVVDTHRLFLHTGQIVDAVAQAEEWKKELEYLQGFLQSVNAKLANEKFVANAKPELVEVERKKQADAVAKIKVLEQNLGL
jgi:valyl-tRNA synthetase